MNYDGRKIHCLGLMRFKTFPDFRGEKFRNLSKPCRVRRIPDRRPPI